jgi:hypothetical protein
LATLLQVDQFHSPAQVDLQRIILGRQAGVGGTHSHVRSETTDANGYDFTIVFAQGARQLEQVQRLLEGDGLDALVLAEAGERGFSSSSTSPIWIMGPKRPMRA